MKTRQVYFEDVNKVSLREADISPGPGEVLVKTHMASICGTDKNHLQGFLPNPLRVKSYHEDAYTSTAPYPRPVGHEGAGTIVEVGRGVEGFSVGDRVMSFGGYITMADYFVAPVSPRGESVTKVPEGLSMDDASLGEPVACAVYAGMESGTMLGDTVLVVGAGFAGQVIAQVVKKMGAGKVIVSDIVGGKLEIAKKLGADIVLDAGRDDVVGVVAQETGGIGADVTIEVAGTEGAIKTCTEAVKHGGIIGLYSWVLHPVNLVIDRWHNDGLDIRTLAVMHRIKHDKDWYQLKALSNVVNGNVNLKPLVTHVFDLADAALAFEASINDPDACKVMLKP